MHCWGHLFWFIKLIKSSKWSSCLSTKKQQEIKRIKRMEKENGRQKKNERKGKGVKREKTADYKSEWKQEWKWVLTIYKVKQTRGIRKGPRGTSKAINEKRRRKRVWNNTWILHFERENKGELGKTEKFEKIKNEASREADSGLDADRSQLKHNTPSLTL